MNIFAPKTRFGAACCALSLLVSFIVGCTPKENPEPKPDPKPQEVAVTDVTLSQTTLSLTIGSSASLTAKVSPDNATNKTVTWSSSKSSVATVSNGTVKAVAEGTATIMAKAGGKSATCLVTVTAKEVAVTGITLSPTTLTIEAGKTRKLTATVTPSNATNATVTWSSSKTSVATVNDGTVTAVAEGEATITATAGGKSAKCTVTVVDSYQIFLPSELALEVGQTYKFDPTVYPTGTKVTWTTSNKSVATVDSDGTLTAVAEGTATITGTIPTATGTKSANCVVTVQANPEAPVKAALMKLYNALDGPNWKVTKKWDLSKPLKDWDFVKWNKETGTVELGFYSGTGLKGNLPDCFDELTFLTAFSIGGDAGVTGTLPPSFAKLKNLKTLSLFGTSMTSLPDIFGDIPLEGADIGSNEKMTGPLPASLCGSSTKGLYISENAFTGTVPDSWARLGTKLQIYGEPNLDERVPDSFVSSSAKDYLINMYVALAKWRDAPVVVGDYDIPAFWPDRDIKDLVTEKSISYKQIVAKNKVTLLLNWATWCPHSKEFMPQLIKMYNKYHSAGFEIIAAFNAQSYNQDSGMSLKEVIKSKGYDKWYNFNLWDFNTTEWSIWCAGTPSAILVDKNGNTIASSHDNVSDPARNRFGYLATQGMVPILESIFGPLEGDDHYASTDYSQDGKVITIQKATTGKGINLVFMGDAYTDQDVNSGLYEQLMREAADQFFSVEPYKSFKNRFNVYAVKVVSKNGKTGTGYTTALGAKIVSGESTTGNSSTIYEYALKVSGITSKKDLTIGVLVNSLFPGGVTQMNETNQSGIAYFSSVGNDPSAFGFTLRHETGGHAFAFLADEYVTHNETMPQTMMSELKRQSEAYGWRANVDFTNDPKKVKWADFLSNSNYKDLVGIYEGGGTYAKGAYRPSEDSIMRSGADDTFNAPSRYAIYNRIMTLSGESHSFSKFVTYDAINRKKNNAPRPNYVEWVPGAPPVVTR